MAAYQRILIIRPSALGDVARSVPVLAALRAAYPSARIDWLVQDSFKDVIVAHPALTHAFTFPRAEFSRWVKSCSLLKLGEYLRSLKEPAYDLVLDCQGLARSGLFAWATRAPERIGHADARELGWLGLTRRVACAPETHTVDRMLTLVEALGLAAPRDPGAMRLYVPASAAGFAESHAIAPRRCVVLAPTSRWPGKQWSAARFAALAGSLVSRGITCVLVGANSERRQIAPLLELAANQPAIIDLVGRTSLAQLMDVLARAACVVANDSAALHIAVGFDRPIVGLFGPTRVHRVGPYRREADVIQHVTAGDAMDHKDETLGRSLMDRITVDEVVEATLARVGSTAAT